MSFAAVFAGKRAVRELGVLVERDLQARLGENRGAIIPRGTVVVTIVLIGMTQAERTDLQEGSALHDLGTKVGVVMKMGRTPIGSWGDFSAGRCLWFLDDVEALPELVPAVGRQSFWCWVGK